MDNSIRQYGMVALCHNFGEVVFLHAIFDLRFGADKKNGAPENDDSNPFGIPGVAQNKK
jgi:hypothetical protein